MTHPPLDQKDQGEYAYLVCQGLEVEPLVGFSFYLPFFVDNVNTFVCVLVHESTLLAKNMKLSISSMILGQRCAPQKCCRESHTKPLYGTFLVARALFVDTCDPQV